MNEVPQNIQELHNSGNHPNDEDDSDATTPSEEMHEEEKPVKYSNDHHQMTTNTQSSSNVEESLKELKSLVTFMSHQMVMMMRVMKVNPCSCELCSRVTQASISSEHQINLQRKTAPHSVLLADYAQRTGGGKISAIDRRTVSEYASTHGGIAAARKFGVAPPVASYYHRKENQGSPGPSTAESDGHQRPEGGGHAGGTAVVCQLVSSAMTAASVPQPPPALSQALMSDVFKMNPAHSTGSPGFLRGRGRGRPKLIGDELDADLVEYMVSRKGSEIPGHLTASLALDYARSYIMEKAPGLLVEQGGHVKLKLTWAMKLVNRVAERQKEIELGLPPGTLSTMGKQHFQDMLRPGGMDVLGVSNMSQEMLRPGMDVLGAPGISQEMLQPRMGTMGSSNQGLSNVSVSGPSATPEIMNVKELDLNFQLNRCSSTGERQSNIGPSGEILFAPEDEIIS